MRGMGKRRRKQRRRDTAGAGGGRGAGGHQVAGQRQPRGAVAGGTFAAAVAGYEPKGKAGAALLWAVFAGVLALPQFFGVKEGGYCGLNPAAPACGEMFPLGENFGYATAYIADEPHYMTLISSVINDGDLDLKNNYANAHAGGFDAGARFRAFPLNHHAYYYLPEGYRWWDVVVPRWDQGLWQPVETEGASADYPPCIRRGPTGELAEQPCRALTFDYLPQYAALADLPEYSWHPPFVPALGYPFLRLFKDSHLLEPAAIFFGYLVTLLSAAFAYWCFGGITSSALTRFAAIAVIFLASPVWHYSRRLLTEPYLAAFLLCAFACMFRGRGFFARYLGGPAFIGLAMTMKSYAVLAMLPVYYATLREQWQGYLADKRAALSAAPPLPTLPIAVRRLLPLAAVSIGPFIGGCAILYWHYLQNGDPFLVPAGSATEGTVEGHGFSAAFFIPHALGMLFSFKYGLLWFCPALIPAAYGWWHLLKRHGGGIALALTMALPYYLFLAFYSGVSLDDTNYGPRYMVALLPLLLVGIIGFLAHAPLRRPATKLLWLLIAASFAINAPAAIASWMFGTRHPFAALLL